MNGSGVRGIAAGGLVLLLALALPAIDATAQEPSPEQLRMLEQLSPEERQRLLREMNLPPEVLARLLEAESSVPERDVSTPPVMQPRKPEQSELERELAAEGELGSLGVEGMDTPLEHAPPPSIEVRQAFENFLAESQPLTVDTRLEQFGYKLFAGAPTTFAPATDVPVTPDYVIGPGDEIHVQLYGKTSLVTDLTVDREGQVSFPELGPISVAGLSFAEMKAALLREVDERMIGVNASIGMGRLRSIRIFVLGEVFQPGSYTVSGLSTLTNALFVSGGVRKIGSLRRVQLKRGGELVREMDLYDLLLAGDTSADERLLPGDVIFVPPAGALVGIAGEVRRPAIYELKGELTARALVELAGGLKALAYGDLLQLERVEGGSRVVYDFDLAKSADWKLRDGDLLKVFPILDREERVVYLAGNVLRPGKRQFSEGLHLLDLVSAPDELLPETYFAYGLIERENELNRETEYLAFDLGAALFDGNEEQNLALQPRDRIYVFHRSHFRELPKVKIRGRVQDPGEYMFEKDMRVLDLILASGGLLKDAWFPEAELFRTDPLTLDVFKIALELERVLDGDPAQNLPLQDLDELMVHSIWEFKEPETVEILGEVNYPGKYPRFEGMRISDLIFAGGYLRQEAYREEAELTRYEIVDGERRELRHLRLDLRAILDGSDEANILLQHYDRLLIRRISNWREDEVVFVSGEIAFPGNYPIEEGERLSNLIRRFGGFLEDAYLPAVVFTRENVRELQQEQLERMARQLEADLARSAVQFTPGVEQTEAAKRQLAIEAGQQLAAELRSVQASGRMVINLDELEKLEGTEFDLVMRNGDTFHVPRKPNHVMVLGQVNNPTAFQYQAGESAGDYIDMAGGQTRFADGSNTYVVRADGSVDRGSKTKLQPGDVVVVPESLERFSGMQFALDLSQVLYQLGIAVASAKTVGAF